MKQNNKKKSIQLFLFFHFIPFLLIFFASGCLNQEESDTDDISYSLDALSDTYSVLSINQALTQEIPIAINNLNNHHIYITFTNTSDSTVSLSDSVLLSSMNSPSELMASLGESDKVFSLPSNPLFQDFTPDSSQITYSPKPTFNYLAGSSVVTDTTTKSWNGLRSGTTPDTIPTTLRGWAQTHKGHRVYLWVENAVWSDSDILEKVSPSKRNVILQLFNGCSEKNGASCDTLDYETSMLYQLENTVAPYWGAHLTSGYLDSSYDEIHVLMYDIDSIGGILGFFYSLDMQPGASNAGYTSNEALIIHLDASDFGHDSDSDSHWRPYQNYSTIGSADVHPKEILSTMLHEMQHMIHYYNRTVVNGINSDTWLNEMTSMVTEDAFSYLYFGPESGPGHSWRMQEYINNPSCNFTNWANTTMKYACAYSFGAFLARQIGSQELLQKIVLSEKNGMDLINDIAFKSGFDYQSMLTRWGSSLVMDSSIAKIPQNYQYQKVENFPVPYDKIKYESIDLFSFTQPPIITEIPPTSVDPYSSSSFLYLKNQYGSKNLQINPQGKVTVTIITEPR